MELFEATRALAQAERLSARTRRAGRWYARYLVVFAAASFLFASLFGVLGSRWGSFVLTPLWTVFLVVLSLWAARARASMVGFARLHLTVIVSWAVLWGVTVTVGANLFERQVGWWLAGGLAMALPCLLGARVAARRTSP